MALKRLKLLQDEADAAQRIADKIGHRQVKRSRRREKAPAIELARRRPAGVQRAHRGGQW